MARWGAIVRDLLPWVALAGLLQVAAFGGIGGDMRELLLKWGPGLLIFLVVAQQVPAFVRATQRQADAMSAMAQELREVPRRDEFKFQDLLIGQELILRELGELKKRIRDER